MSGAWISIKSEKIKKIKKIAKIILGILVSIGTSIWIIQGILEY